MKNIQKYCLGGGARERKALIQNRVSGLAVSEMVDGVKEIKKGLH